MAEELIVNSNKLVEQKNSGFDWARIDALTIEILLERLHSVETRSTNMGKELLNTQKQMETLRLLFAEIVNSTNRSTGELNGKENKRLQELLKEAEGLGLTYNNPKGDFVFDKFDRDNLVANLDDLKKSKQTMLNYQTKQVEHLLTEQTESMKFAHKIEQTHSEIKRKVASNIKGG